MNKPKREFMNSHSPLPLEKLAADVAEYFVGEKRPVSRTELVRLIVADSNATKLWPDEPYERWNRAIDIAAEMGLIRLVAGVVHHVEQPKPVSSGEEQLELF